MRMTKKITSIVLAVLMVVSMMSVMAVSASAATAVDVDSETAFVNAVNDANANPINITGDFALNQVVTFNSNKTVNFNDKTVTVNVNRAIVVETGKTVTFKGTTGGLYTNGDVGFILNKGTLNVHGGVYNALNMTTGGLSVVKNEPNAWFNMQGGEINAKYYGIYTHGENSRVWIQNTAKVHSVDASAISGNGLAANKGYYIYINGGTITSDNNSAIYHPNEGTLQISPYKSQITIQGATAIYTKAGTTNITANKVNPDLLQIIGTGAKVDYEYNGDGTTPTGDAVVIDNCNYPSGGPVVDIKFGTFTSTNGNAIASYVGQDDTNYKGADQERVKNFISIGYEGYEPVFSSEVPAEYLAEDVKRVDNGDGTYTVAAKVYVAQDVATGTKYESVNEAVAAAGEGGEVKLIADITGNVGIDGDYTTTLDLNGYTITNPTGSGITLYSKYPGGKTFTIKDTSAAQTGGITITKKYPGDGCISDSSGRKVVIEGGTYTSNDKALYISSNEGWTINGGTFNGKVHVISDVDITDGTFNGEIVQSGKPDYSTPYPWTEIPAEIEISGGTFANPVPADFCANGYAPKDNGDGTYGVGPDTSNPLNPIEKAAADINDGNAFGINVDYLKGTLLGVQTKFTDKIDESTSSQDQLGQYNIRFVAVLDTELIQNMQGADDYGFVLAKVGSNKDYTNTNIENLKANWGNGEKTISAKGTYNNVCGNTKYGDPTDDSTDYKYVTCAVNNMNASDKVLARFYYTKNGTTYYAKYAGQNYQYTGCISPANPQS